MIALTPEDVRHTPGAVLNRNFLEKRPLTGDEIELVRKSDWLRQEAIYEPETFALVRRCGAAGFHVRLVVARPEEGKEYLPVHPIEYPYVATEVVSDIEQRFSRRYQFEKDYRFGEWGVGWPNENPGYGSFRAFHPEGSGIPTAETPPPYPGDGDWPGLMAYDR